MSNTEYNGWTNYATWRVNLEYGLNDGGFEGYDHEALKDFVEDDIERQAEGLARDYALAFLSDVNWHEIAKHIKEG